MTLLLQENLSLLTQRGIIAPREVEEASPKEIEQERLGEVDLEGVELLYLLGIGDGSSYHEVKAWLHESSARYLVFLESDLGRLRSWLESPEASEVLRDPQVKLFLCHSEAKRKMLYTWTYTFFAGMPSRFTALPSYQRDQSELVTELADRFGTFSFETHVILQEIFGKCANSLDNTYDNLRHLHRSGWANRLYGKFKGVPAIICGAGPSLAKNGEQLRDLSDRALIFAPGSTLNALCEKGISPHFGVGVDPNPDQYSKMEAHSAFEVPLFYVNRWRKGALPLWQGDTLFVSGVGLHRLEHWIEEELGIEAERFRGGHTATHQAIELARLMGCNPIILVGQDLAYTEGRFYDGSVTAFDGARSDDLHKTGHFQEKPIERLDCDGKPTQTAWKWVLEARWLTQFAAEYPELKMINATEGGLLIEGIEHLPLADVARRDLSRSFPLLERVTAEVASANLCVTKEKVDALLDQVRESLGRAAGFAAELLEELRQMRERKTLPHNLRSGRAALFEADLRDELCYKLIFSGLLDHASTILSRKIEQIRRLSEEKQLRELLEIEINKAEFVVHGIEIQQAKLGV